MYHILAVVKLEDDKETIFLDKSKIYLIPKNEVDSAPENVSKLEKFRMTHNHVNSLFTLKKDE